MPVQSVWMIRLSLMHLLIAVIIGGLLLIHKTTPLHPGIWALLPVHFELAIWGWLVQFVMGTAYWMFPRHLTGEARGGTNRSWIMIVLFNSGTLLLVTGYFLPEISYIPLIARFSVLLSILLFISLMWKRVVTYRNLHD